MRILIIDNYDSFVYNLAQYSGLFCKNITVRRNDLIDEKTARKLRPDRIIISPGPGNPSKNGQFGHCTEILRTVSRDIPTLGVCLGHQGIVHAFGGRIINARRIVHGKTSWIRHDGKGIYRGLNNPLEATRYHSLVADRRSLQRSFEITAESLDDHEIMGVRHTEFPIEGVQFHPESILTPAGNQLIQNFLVD